MIVDPKAMHVPQAVSSRYSGPVQNISDSFESDGYY